MFVSIFFWELFFALLFLLPLKLPLELLNLFFQFFLLEVDFDNHRAALHIVQIQIKISVRETALIQSKQVKCINNIKDQDVRGSNFHLLEGLTELKFMVLLMPGS